MEIEEGCRADEGGVDAWSGEMESKGFLRGRAGGVVGVVE